MWKNTQLYYPNEPTIENWKDFIASLRELTGTTLQIHFAGGEPILKNETIELIRYANDSGFGTLLATNGYLIDKEMSIRINDAGLTSIVISLDSLNAEVHDFLRGKHGVCQKVMEAIRDLSNYSSNTDVGISTVISQISLDGLLDLARWAQQNDEVDSIRYQVVTQIISDDSFPNAEWYKSEEYGFLWPKDVERACSVIDELIRFKEDTEKNSSGCKIGNAVSQLRAYKDYFRNTLRPIRNRKGCPREAEAITVDPFGDVFLCNFMGAIGNIKKNNIKHILFSKKAHLRRTKMSQCEINCMAVLNCNFEEENILEDVPSLYAI